MRKENTIKKQQLLKQPVKIRYKLLKNNNKSLYLDTYINGKRQYEFLHLYLIPEIDENCRLINQPVSHNYQLSYMISFNNMPKIIKIPTACIADIKPF